MPIPPALPSEDLAEAISNLHPDWDLVNGKLHREFTFSSFVTAFGFMSSVALHAEREHHHPEWSNVYNRVTIDLVTHEANGITVYDLDLASKIDALA